MHQGVSAEIGLIGGTGLYDMPGLEEIRDPRFSDEGREIVFGTIGNASCAEGLFWESVNAIGVLQVPAVISNRS